jgi:hypothetical protein
MFKIEQQMRVDQYGRDFLEVCVAREPREGKNWPCKFFKFNTATHAHGFRVERDWRVGSTPDDFVLMYRVGDNCEDVGLPFTLGEM